MVPRGNELRWRRTCIFAACRVLARDAHARLAYVGDPHQVPEHGCSSATAAGAKRTRTLDVIHRFGHTVGIPGVLGTVDDLDYARPEPACGRGKAPPAIRPRRSMSSTVGRSAATPPLRS